MINKNIIGIDIEDAHLRVLQLSSDNEVVSYGAVPLEEGVVQNGHIADCESFTEICEKLLSHTKPTPIKDNFLNPRALVSLPSERVWLQSVTVPNDIPKESQQTYVAEEVQKLLPLDIESLYYRILIEEAQDLIFATFVGAKKTIIDDYVTCLSKAGLDVSFIGSNFLSTARAVLPKSEAQTSHIIVSISKYRTTIGAFDKNARPYIIIPSLVSAKDLKKDIAQASKSASEKKESGSAALKTLIFDITHVLDYFTQQSGQQISRIIVTGEYAEKIDIVPSLQKGIDVEVVSGEAYQHISETKLIKPKVSPSSLSSVIGLAMYGVNPSLPHANLLLTNDKVLHKQYNIEQFRLVRVVQDIYRQVLQKLPLSKIYVQLQRQKTTVLLAGIFIAISVVAVVVFF